jgi:hypothetical protein
MLGKDRRKHAWDNVSKPNRTVGKTSLAIVFATITWRTQEFAGQAGRKLKSDAARISRQ